MPAVLDIEQQSFLWKGWSEEDFLSCLQQRNCIGMVAERDGKILGFVVFELHKKSLHILKLAVCLFHRRQGIGRQMIDKLIDKHIRQGRSKLSIEVEETNLGGQLFLKTQGFRATLVRRDYYGNGEDAYVMVYDRVGTPELRQLFKNRISKYFEIPPGGLTPPRH